MHKLDGKNTTATMPAMGAVGGSPGWAKVEGNVPPTQVTGEWINAIQAELINAIEGSGITLDKADNGQLYDAIASLGGRLSLWRRAYPLGSGGSVHYIGGDSGDVLVEQTGNITKITRVSTDACAVQIAWPLPMDVREIEISDLLFRVKLQTAFTGTVTALTAYIYRVNTDGSTTSLGSAALNGLTPGSWTLLTNAHFSITPLALGEGEAIYLQVNASISGGGAGEVQFSMLSLTLGEGG